MNLRLEATRGVLWTAWQNIIMAVVSFAAIMLLARYVAPIEFGLMAEAWALVFVVSQVGRLGLVEALVATKERSLVKLAAVFWLQLAVSCLLALLLQLAAPFWASLFDRPELTGLVRILSWVVILEGLGTVPQALLESELRFSALAQVRILASVAASVVAVLMALSGWGLNSLVAQALVMVILRNFGLVVATRYRPLLRLRGGEIVKLVRFGWRVAGTQLLSLLNMHGAFMITGYLLGEYSLGIFKVAWDLFDKIYRALTQPFLAVALPTFARLTDNGPRFNHAVVVALRTQAVLLLPACVGLALIAGDAYPLLLGARWQEGIPLLRAFCTMGCFFAFVSLLPQVLWTKNRPGQVLVVRMGIVTLQLGSLAVFSNYGVRSATWAYVLSYPLLAPVYCLLLQKATGLRPGQYLVELVRFLPALAVMAAVTMLVKAGAESWASWLGLALQVLAGVVAYFLALMAFAPKTLTHVSSLLVKGISGDDEDRRE